MTNFIFNILAPGGPPTSIRVEAIDEHKVTVYWKPPVKADWNGEILGYYVGHKLTSSDSLYFFETVEFSKEEGKEHHLEITDLK